MIRKKKLKINKLKLKKRKEKAMNKMNEKRQKIIKKCGIDTETSSNNDSISYSSEKDEIDIPKCQKCYEDLISENFSSRPYGYLSCVVKTKIYYDSIKQTYYELKENDKRMNEDKLINSNIKLLEFDEKSIEQLQFLNQDLTGTVIKTCKHMIHYDCLISYKENTCKNRMRKMLIEDFDIDEYPCPLCKSYCNSLIPPQKELIELIKGESIEIFDNGNKNLLENLMIDVINMINMKSCTTSGLKMKNFSCILPKDIPKLRQEIIGKHICNYINHMIQLVDTKSLSWVLEEKNKIKTIMNIGVLLLKYEFDPKKEIFNLQYIKLFEEIESNKRKQIKDLLKINVSNIIVDTLIKLYYQKCHEGKEIKFNYMSKLMKICYAFVLLQISAKIKYEKSGFLIRNRGDIVNMESLINVIKNMESINTESGKLIDISKRFIEGSLSFMRKMIIIVLLIVESDNKEKDDHLKFIKKLANKNFSIDPSEELYILFELIGWNNQSVSENFSFYHIIEQVENMETQEDYLLSEFALFYLEGCGLNQMEVSSEKNDKNEEFEEEEKIDTSSRPKMIINPNMIPTWCYMITPDLYFTLPKFCRTLEEMTKKYYNKKCSLCKSISKRSAICIVCEEYLCVAKCNFDSKSKDYGKGNLTLHSEKCGGGSSIFIGPVEGQLIYIYNGLAMEAKSPYVDKYGECFDENEKKYDTYSLDDIQYDKIREDILDFNIPNTVITKRAGMTRVYRQNVF